MRQLLEYNTFVDKGINCTPTSGYKKIWCHMVYDVKHDGRHKAHLVEGGHLTDPNAESVYFGVVLLRIRLVFFLAELNGLEQPMLEMLILKQKQRRRYKLLVVLNSVLLKGIRCLLIMHCMD
jgi:hypothetical protein